MSASKYDWPEISEAYQKAGEWEKRAVEGIFHPGGLMAPQLFWSDLPKDGQNLVVTILGLPQR